MILKAISISILALASLGMMIFAAVVEFGREPSALRSKCPEGTVPSHHVGECRELLPVETDTTFPWDRQQAEARDFYRKFQANIAADRRSEVVAMMMYPLRINYYTDPKAADYRFLNSQAELLTAYDKVFHRSVKNYIANFDANDLWGNYYFLQTGYGQIGIYCTTMGECPSCDFEFKVKIVASNTIYRETIEDDFGNPIKSGSTP